MLRHLTRVRAMSTIHLLSLSSFFAQCYFYIPVMTPYLLQRNLSLAEIAGLQTTILFVILLMEIPTGVIADRMGHVWSYRIALALLLVGDLVFLGAREYITFLLVQLIWGTGYAFTSGSVDAIIYDHLPEENRLGEMQRAKGFFIAATQMGSVVAYPVGGLIAANLTLSRMTVCIVLAALAMTTATAMSFRLKEASHVQRAERLPSLALLRSAWSAIQTSPDIRRLLLYAIVTNGFSAHLLVFYQDYFLKTGVPGAWLGIALGAGSIVIALVSLHAWRLSAWLGRRWAMIVAAGAPGILYLAMGANTMSWPAVVLFVLLWGSIGVSGPLLSGLNNELLPSHSRATCLSLLSAIVTVYMGLGGLFLGWLAEWSVRGTFALLGIFILAGSLLVQIPADRQPAIRGELHDAF